MKKKVPFAKRAELCRNPAARALCEIAAEKKSNLVANIDVAKADHLLATAEKIGDEIALLKTHVDLLEDFSAGFIRQLTQLAVEKRFLLFEDRKFADIGVISREQYRGGIYNIASWADITNAHIIPGPSIIEGLAEVGAPLGRGVLLLAEMSAKGALTDAEYAKRALKMAEGSSSFVMGFICQHRISEDPSFLHLTPGVQLTAGGDSLGQQFRTPHHAIERDGCDMIIVGRGITSAQDPRAEAARYREVAWETYCNNQEGR